MLNLSDESEKHSDHNVREDNEYVRLVISSELGTAANDDGLQPRAETRHKSFTWWIKVLTWCTVTIVLTLIFVKWGVPFLFEKVCHILCAPSSLFFYFFIGIRKISLHKKIRGESLGGGDTSPSYKIRC